MSNIRVLNIEDDILKHFAIKTALDNCKITSIDSASNAEDGLKLIETAIHNGNPYELLILDMQFPVNGKYHNEAGLYIIDELKKKGISIPIIICSSLRLQIPEVIDCLFYNPSKDLNSDMRDALKKGKLI